MLRTLAIFALLLTAADHMTTYLCLREPVPGWDIAEMNPIADWLFNTTGLVPGLLIDTLVTMTGVAFLLTTALFTRRMKLAFLAFISLATGFAVANNLTAMVDLGLAPLGSS